jgi:antitoxin component YwqK of YwqJK toxin-antitoxin module
MKTLKRCITVLFCLILISSCTKSAKSNENNKSTISIDWGLEKDNFKEKYGDNVYNYDPFNITQDTLLYKGEAFTGELFGEFTIDGEGRYSDEVIIKFKYNFKGGLLNGLRELYYENNQLMSVSNFKNGKQDGISEDYDKSGQLEYKRNYKDGEETNDSFHDNGQLKSRLKDGLIQEYYENGQLKAKFPYIGAGQIEIYYENGQLQGKFTVGENGAPDWKIAGVESYYENGQLAGKINKEGDYEQYDESGQLKDKGNMKNGAPLDLMKNMIK